MECSSKDELENFLKMTDSPAGRRYWVEDKRKIIYEIFKPEILDQTLPVPDVKIRDAIKELGETPGRPTEARIRIFIHRLRHKIKDNHQPADPSPIIHSDRKQRLEKRNVNRQTADISPIIHRDRKQRLEKSDVNSKPVDSASIPDVDTPKSRKEEKSTYETRRVYWTKPRREVICKVFKEEIINLDLQIGHECNDKINKAIDLLGDEDKRRSVGGIRTFVNKYRKDRKRKLDKGETVTPLPSDSESSDENTSTDSDDVPQLVNENGVEMETGNINDEDESKNEPKRTNLKDPEPLNENVEMNSNNINDSESKISKEEAKVDTDVESFNENAKVDSNNMNDDKSEIAEKESKVDTESSSENANVDLKNINNDKSEISEEETKVDAVVGSLNEDATDSKNVNRGDRKSYKDDYRSSDKSIQKWLYADRFNLDGDEEERKLDPDVQSLNKNTIDLVDNNKSTPENRSEETECNSAAQLLSENGTKNSGNKIKVRVSPKRKMDGDHNEVSSQSSPKRLKPQWNSEMAAVMFAEELTKSNWPLGSDKVDTITNFLKSCGFNNVTRETVIAWGNNHSKKLDSSPELPSDQVIESLVAGIINDNIDIKSGDTDIKSEEPKPEESNDTKDTPSEQSCSKSPIDEDSLDIDLPPKKLKLVDDPIPNNEEAVMEK